jgi:hypothetical protein
MAVRALLYGSETLAKKNKNITTIQVVENKFKGYQHYTTLKTKMYVSR